MSWTVKRWALSGQRSRCRVCPRSVLQHLRLLRTDSTHLEAGSLCLILGGRTETNNVAVGSVYEFRYPYLVVARGTTQEERSRRSRYRLHADTPSQTCTRAQNKQESILFRPGPCIGVTDRRRAGDRERRGNRMEKRDNKLGGKLPYYEY